MIMQKLYVELIRYDRKYLWDSKLRIVIVSDFLSFNFQNVVLFSTYCVHHYVRYKFIYRETNLPDWCEQGIKEFKNALDVCNISSNSDENEFVVIEQAVKEAEKETPKTKLDYRGCKN